MSRSELVLPKFSLRAHKATLTCITHHQDTLISADRDGWIIVWNLASRRPIALWKGHDGHILTLKLSNMGLVSHGRDSRIRIWKTDQNAMEKCSRNGSDVSSVGAKPDPALPMPPHAEIPVNALNFCNVDFCDGLLITPATVDSDNFDVYEVSDPFGAFNVKRVLQNISPQNLGKSESIVEAISSSMEPEKRGGNGIIMRTLFLKRDLFFVGYESGAIYGFRVEHANHDVATSNERVVIFNDYKLTVVFKLLDHKPLPVLSVKLDAATAQLYTGSASKKLLIYNIEGLLKQDDSYVGEEGTPQYSSHNLRHYGIQCIEITSSMVLAGFWDGIIKVCTKELEEITRLERKEESIRPEGDEGLSRPAKKSLCMDFWLPQARSSESNVPESRKVMLRKTVVGSDPLLFIGYADGLITAFLGIY